MGYPVDAIRLGNPLNYSVMHKSNEIQLAMQEFKSLVDKFGELIREKEEFLDNFDKAKNDAEFRKKWIADERMKIDSRKSITSIP